MSADLFAAIDRGTRGATAAADHADDTLSGWTDLAVDDLRRFAATATRPFTIEQARAHCLGIPQGCDARAWGVVTRIAMKRGFIRFAGYFLPAASSHGSMKPLYVRGEGA